MSERTLELILFQMIEAVHNMRAFAEGMTFTDYQADPTTRLAMERCVEIISEAARHLPSSV